MKTAALLLGALICMVQAAPDPDGGYYWHYEHVDLCVACSMCAGEQQSEAGFELKDCERY